MSKTLNLWRQAHKDLLEAVAASKRALSKRLAFNQTGRVDPVLARALSEGVKEAEARMGLCAKRATELDALLKDEQAAAMAARIAKGLADAIADGTGDGVAKPAAAPEKTKE